MKSFILAGAAATMAAMIGTAAMAHHTALLGNDLPHIAGKAEKLHLHAYDTCREQEFEGSNRNVIMLQADFDEAGHTVDLKNAIKTNDIFLIQAVGEINDFTVLDGNACENSEDDGALFALPSDISTEWAAFLRMRGQPDTGIDIATCWFVEDGNDVACGDNVVRVRDAGKPSVDNVTRQLLTTVDFSNFETWWEVFTDGNMKATIYFYPCDEIVGVC